MCMYMCMHVYVRMHVTPFSLCAGPCNTSKINRLLSGCDRSKKMVKKARMTASTNSPRTWNCIRIRTVRVGGGE